MVLLTDDLTGDHAGIRVLTLNRPERRNALSGELVDALTRALADANRDDAVRAIVLTGAGEKAFCAGGDLGSAPADGFFAQHKERGAYAELLLALRRGATPVIAAVNGTALGGGFGLVLAADLAVCADHAELGTPEVKRGLFPMMISALLYDALPAKEANALALLGRTLPAARAHALGLVNSVHPVAALRAAALDLAREVAALSPAVLQLGKRAVALQRQMPAEERLMFLRDQLTLNLQLEDAAEGIGAFIEKRAPVWKGR